MPEDILQSLSGSKDQLAQASETAKGVASGALSTAEAFKIPEGTASGATFRIRGRGMPDVVSGRSRGDLLVTVKVGTPKKLTKEQRKLLEQLAETLPKEKFEPTPREEHDDRGIFDRVKDIFG